MHRHRQVARILRVAALIHAQPRHYTRQTLAERCGASLRTIQRDIEVLREMNIRAEYVQEADRRGYEITSEFFLPAIELTLEEALALVTAAQAFSAHEGRYARETLEEAMAKLLAAIPSRTVQRLQQLDQQLDVGGHKMSEVDGTLEQLFLAVRERRCAEMRYYLFRQDRVVTRVLEPYAVFFRKRAWYVAGRSRDFNMVLTFRVNRIQHLFLSRQRFHRPEDWSLKGYLIQAWDVMSGQEADVVVHFSRNVAYLIKEVNWHPTQQIEDRPDGSILFRATVAGTQEIGWWILSYGDDAEVLEPLELRERIAETARRMVEKYAGREDG